MTRQLALLVQAYPPALQTERDVPTPLGWLPEPSLVNPLRLVAQITENTVIQNIQVVDPVFGHQTVQYITTVEPSVSYNTSNNKETIKALWEISVPAPTYSPGQARANPHFTPGVVRLDGARSDFTVRTSLHFFPHLNSD